MTKTVLCLFLFMGYRTIIAREVANWSIAWHRCACVRGSTESIQGGYRSILEESESLSPEPWCIPGFGAGFLFALEPSELQKQAENAPKGHSFFSGAKLWYAPNPGSEEI